MSVEMETMKDGVERKLLFGTGRPLILSVPRCLKISPWHLGRGTNFAVMTLNILREKKQKRKDVPRPKNFRIASVDPTIA